MHIRGRSHHSLFRVSWDPASVGIAILLALLFLMFLFLFLAFTAQPLRGQTSEVIHTLNRFHEARCLLSIGAV